MTLGDRLDECRGIGPGFDHLRVGLSLLIFFWHCFGISYGVEWTRTAYGLPVLLALLPMFFSLSGFLIMGSAVRTGNLRTFISFRTLRIAPALGMEIALSAMILGPILTVLPLGQYFSDPQFFAYFGSLIGRVKYTLPGLFVGNPIPYVVNGALWTIAPEILCYIIMALLMMTAIFRNRNMMVFSTIAYLLLCIATDYWVSAPILEKAPMKVLILSFLAGNLVFLFRDKLPFSVIALILVGAVSLGFLYLVQTDVRAHLLMYPAALGLAYMTAAIGFLNLPPLPFFHRGDYSYGIYLYGFPIQQSLAHLFPALREWYWLLLAALPLTIAFAAASWHWLEKPVLALRKRFSTSPNSNPVKLGWRHPRRVGPLMAVVLYGLFVMAVSNVFPLRPITATLVGMYMPVATQP